MSERLPFINELSSASRTATLMERRYLGLAPQATCCRALSRANIYD